MINEDLLALIVCPIGRAPLRLEGETLVCTRCGPRFSIKVETCRHRRLPSLSVSDGPP